jgi:hypothetical protein
VDWPLGALRWLERFLVDRRDPWQMLRPGSYAFSDFTPNDFSNDFSNASFDAGIYLLGFAKWNRLCDTSKLGQSVNLGRLSRFG